MMMLLKISYIIGLPLFVWVGLISHHLLITIEPTQAHNTVSNYTVGLSNQPMVISATKSVDNLTPAQNNFIEFKQTINRPTQKPQTEIDIYNGDIVIYTLALTKPETTKSITVEITNLLPENVLDDIECDITCTKVYEIETITDPFHNRKTTITTVRELTWTLHLPSSFVTKIVSFSGRVTCQTEQTAFRNQAFARNIDPDANDFIRSNDTQANIQVFVNGIGEALLSDRPTWCSEDGRGTIKADWADFDNDGDLDLVIASTAGLNVYQSDGYQLDLFWSNNEYILDARWADVIPTDTYLEIVSVGRSVDNNEDSEGENDIYRYNPTATVSSRRFERAKTFTSTKQLFLVEPGDFDNDNDVDLVVTTKATNPNIVRCPIRFYRNDGQANFVGSGACIGGTQGAKSLSIADYNNDGYLDLTAGLKNNFVQLFINQTNTTTNTTTTPFTVTKSQSIDSSSVSEAHDLAWGDYNNDGFLDLAAAFTLGETQQVRIYQNQQGQRFQLQTRLDTEAYQTPRAIDWGDFNGDGRLDLVVADIPPIIYQSTSTGFEPIDSLQVKGIPGSSEIPIIRAIDQNNDGDLDLFMGDLNGTSFIFTNYAPLLNPTITVVVDGFKAHSVAWGDVNNDGTLDLLLGGQDKTKIGSRIYKNSGKASPRFEEDPIYLDHSPGPHVAILGDVNGNGQLDIMLGTANEDAIYYLNEKEEAIEATPNLFDRLNTSTVAWGDADEDSNGLPDLLVGTHNGPLILYHNQTTNAELLLNPITIDNGPLATTSVAWADYDLDGNLDFAVGNKNQPTTIYRNLGQIGQNAPSFAKVWRSNQFYPSNNSVVAWADYDSDGDYDLTIGNNGYNFIYKNLVCENDESNCRNIPLRNSSTIDLTPDSVWTSPTAYHTTSLTWGDWDNDGDLDLAVGNYGQPDEVYGNVDGQLALLWRSNISYATTGLAWGDWDNDGDLDLAISQDGDDGNGVYENNYIIASHLLDDNFVEAMPLQNNPTYLHIESVSPTNSPLPYTSADILLSNAPTKGTIPINYIVYDADGSRNPLDTDATGDKILNATYQFSLDGGGTWQPATVGQAGEGVCDCSDEVDIDCKDFGSQADAQTCYNHCLAEGAGDVHELDGDGDGLVCEALIRPRQTLPLVTNLPTLRKGQATTFLWDARTDQAITDNGRFRICVAPQQDAGRIQRGLACALSPPFRVRATSCVWPDKPVITIKSNTASVQPGQMINFNKINQGKDVAIVEFLGNVKVGTGVLTYTWQIGDNEYHGQKYEHTFSEKGIYNIELTVTGESCPIKKEVKTARTVFIEVANVFLPTIFKGS